jgi:hypothetical protein
MISTRSIIRTVLIHMAVGEASGISLQKVTRHEIPLLNSTSSVKGQQVCNKLLIS